MHTNILTPRAIYLDFIIQNITYFTIDCDKSVEISLGYFNTDKGGYSESDKVLTVAPSQIISGDDMMVEVGLENFETL